MPYETKYISGTYNVICDRCGFQIKAKDAMLTWDNLLVCPEDYEPKHEHLYPHPVVNDPRPIKEVQPETEDVFRTIGDVTEDDF